MVGFIDKVLQRFTGVMGVVAVNRGPHMVVDKFLENFPRDACTKDEKILADQGLVQDDTSRAGLIIYGHG